MLKMRHTASLLVPAVVAVTACGALHALFGRNYPSELGLGPYGEDKPVPEKARPLTISLAPSLVIQLEDAAMANKRAGKGPKTASAIIREGLAAIGFVE